MALIKKEDGLIPAYDSLWGNFFSGDFFNNGLELGKKFPAVNTKETEKSYDVEVALPGFNKDDIKVDVDNDVITISSEKKQKKEVKDGEKGLRREFSYSSFSRSFQLPNNVDDENISAKYKDGLLKLNLPKSKSSKTATKQIEVK